MQDKIQNEFHQHKACITYYVACFDTHIAQNEITTQQTF